jgi:hypothetical protein
MITYSFQNTECRRIHNNPDKCPQCGCEDNELYEYDGNEGQDRANYTDNQDRKNYLTGKE